MRNLIALAAVVCGTIIACSGPAWWSAPAWGLAALILARRGD